MSTEIQKVFNDNFIEPILDEASDRLTLFPLKYSNILDYFYKAQAMNWTDVEIDLSHDQTHWKKISVVDQLFIKNILAFFAVSDKIIMDNLSANFSSEVKIPEVTHFYAHQNYIEGVHNITYNKIIDTIIQDPNEKRQLFEAVKTMPGVAKKANWAIKWFESSRPFAERLLAAAIVEGIFFSGSFSAIFWLRNRYRGLMPGLIQANELIMRDEGLHQEFGVYLLVNVIEKKLQQSVVHEIVSEAVEVEISFMSDALPNSLLGMNISLMSEHIKYVANRLVKQLGYAEIYMGVSQPFDFMTNMSITTVADFFGPSKETQYNIGDKYMGVPLEYKEDDDF